MPYLNEVAQYNSIRRISESNRIREILRRYKLTASPATEAAGGELYTLIARDQLNPGVEVELPDYVLSIDGSYAEVPVANGFASAKVGYTTISDVLLHLTKLNELDAHRPVDPREMRKTQTSGAADTVLAGCNITFDGELDPQSSFRRGVIDLFRDQRAFEDGETLLETYEALLAYKPMVPVQACPYAEACGHEDPQQAFQRVSGTSSCSCPRQLSCHSTDALRIYERFNPLGENGTAFGEVIHVTERLWLMHTLRSMEQRRMYEALSKLAIVLDGPLAVFGRPGWLSRAIGRELQRINKVVKKKTGKDLFLVGIEKSGIFVEHFAKLCREEGSKRTTVKIPKETALLPTDEYIRRFVVYSKNTHPYGDVTYFGRKFFYRTKSGGQIVATLPFLDPKHRDLNTASPEQYPRLLDALNLFDALGSSRYPNALVPISLAHGEASIPLRLGSRVLEVLARELIPSNNLV